jgi:hypothetical protein
MASQRLSQRPRPAKARHPENYWELKKRVVCYRKMNTTTLTASLSQATCPRCPTAKPESAGYYTRNVRSLEGRKSVKVLKIRCSCCKKMLASVQPPGVQPYKWYTENLQDLFAILKTHQVNEACRQEIATLLGFPILPETQAAWQDTGALRARRHHDLLVEEVKNNRKNNSKTQSNVIISSIDEFKLGDGWIYTSTDVLSKFVLVFKSSANRSSEVVRDIIGSFEPDALLSDGCAAIIAGAQWFSYLPHGRCWFHVMEAILDKFTKEQREERMQLTVRLQMLYSQETLPIAEKYLSEIEKLYDPSVFEPLRSAWDGLKQRWLFPKMPLTNNTSEQLYNALWSRERKRVVKTEERKTAWVQVARCRWNHHRLGTQSPAERLIGRPSPHWLNIVNRPFATLTRSQ